MEDVPSSSDGAAGSAADGIRHPPVHGNLDLSGWLSVVHDKATAFQELTETCSKERKQQKNQRRMAAWISSQSEDEKLEERYGSKTWRLKLLRILQSRKFQLLLTLLLCFDIIIVVTELFIEAEFPQCSVVKRDAVSCCSMAALGEASSHGSSAGEGSSHGSSAEESSHGSSGGRRLSGAGGDHALCDAPFHDAPQYEVGCDGHKYPGVHLAHDIMFASSTGILAFFELELLLLMLALGTLFFMNPLYLLDLTVVSASLSLDLHMKFGPNTGSDTNATLLIIARCWRFVRIGHGIMSSAHEQDMKKIEELVELAKEMQADTDHLKEQVMEYNSSVLDLDKINDGQPADSQQGATS